MTFGGVLIYIRNISADYLKTKDNCIQHFQKADEASILASEIFCQLYCPCALDAATAAQAKVNNFYKGSCNNVLTCNPCESIRTYNVSVQTELKI